MRGFLFAPLLGTIIVLATLLFVTHILRMERMGVALTTSDSYHNRLVSLLETTRSDTASAFKLGMEKSIVDYTISQGWSGVSTYSGGDMWSVCDSIQYQMHAGVCSIVRTAGLPYWLTLLKQPIYFEGVVFKPCDADKYEKFIQAMINITKCGSVFSRDMFNCSAIDKGGDCFGLPGCDDGSFWLRVGVTNVYELLPRLCSEDGFGNQIRSEAIAGEDFGMHVRLRVFQYIRTAGKVADALAYGSGEGCNGIVGIKDGLCVGVSCDNISLSWNPEANFSCGENKSFTSQQDARSELERRANQLANFVCKDVKEEPGRDLYVPNCEGIVEQGLKDRLIAEPCKNNYCAYIEGVTISLTLVDTDKRYGMTMESNITYPFTIDLEYRGT